MAHLVRCHCRRVYRCERDHSQERRDCWREPDHAPCPDEGAPEHHPNWDFLKYQGVPPKREPVTLGCPLCGFEYEGTDERSLVPEHDSPGSVVEPRAYKHAYEIKGVPCDGGKGRGVPDTGEAGSGVTGYPYPMKMI